MNEPPIYVINVAAPDGAKDYVTVTPPDQAFSGGLISEGIVGVLKRPLAPDEAITPENFAPNPAFSTFLAEVIARHGPQQPGFGAEAERIGNGHVIVVDRRTPTPDGPVPPEDILGAFRVQGGIVVAGSYMASPNHRLLTSNGFFRLDGALSACLQRELSARSSG